MSCSDFVAALDLIQEAKAVLASGLLRLYYASVKALLRLCSGSVTPLLRLCYASVKALLR
jgi:hypothetical protein